MHTVGPYNHCRMNGHRLIINENRETFTLQSTRSGTTLTQVMGILGRKTGDKVAIRHGKCARETCTNSELERSDRDGRWLKGPLARLRRWVAATKDAG